VPEAKAGKNRLHLDLYVSGGRTVELSVRRERVDARVAELVALGASIDHAAETYDHYFVVMHDPEGNEFCVA
jgi:Glyoxalase-like domain